MKIKRKPHPDQIIAMTGDSGMSFSMAAIMSCLCLSHTKRMSSERLRTALLLVFNNVPCDMEKSLATLLQVGYIHILESEVLITPEGNHRWSIMREQAKSKIPYLLSLGFDVHHDRSHNLEYFWFDRK